MKFKDVILISILLFFVGIVSLTYKNIQLQKEFFEKGEEYFSQRKYIPAIDAYERVILAYVPFSPYTTRALDKIKEICTSLTGYDKLYCYETIRASLFQIQSFYQPFEKDKKEATEKIISLRTDLYVKDLNIQDAEEKERLHSVMEELTKKEFNPDKFWSFLAPVSLIGWVGFIIAGIWYGKRYYILSLISFIVWVVSLYMA